MRRWLPLAAVAILYLLHNDWWLWNDGRRIAGLPAGLAYHVGYCLVASFLLWLLVRSRASDGDARDADTERAPR